MLRSASGVFGKNAAPQLEIRPDSPFVVFYGNASQAQNAELTGKLVLSSAESLSVKAIRITLTGTRKVSWIVSNTVTPQPMTQKTVFLHETVNLFPIEGSKNKPHKINAGVHEWDFKFTLPKDLDESIEGLPSNWIVYNLKATLDRGMMSKPLTANSHIRVIRTLGRDLLETTPMDQISEDIWGSKMAYKIIVPQKNYIVGTSITADFILIPLRKGIEISNIKLELVESRQLWCDFGGRRVSHSLDTQAAVKEGPMPESSTNLVPDGVEDNELFDECHRFSMTLDLPKSLKTCRQSVDTDYLKVVHKLRLYVNILNPEGHTSQLLVKNHINLFISPNLPPQEDQSVIVDANLLSQQAAQNELNQNAPPTYGLHQLDELYHDIDPSGFMTPGGFASVANSGTNTPFYAHSRAGSVENLAPSLDAVADAPSAAALQYRLQNLHLSQNVPPHRFPLPRQNSSGGSTPHSLADDASYHLPLFFTADYDMTALLRTPSYNTAVRTPIRTASVDDLPTYEIATSRPSSPNRSPRRQSPNGPRMDTLTEETQRNTALNGGGRRVVHRARSASANSSSVSLLPPTVAIPTSDAPLVPLILTISDASTSSSDRSSTSTSSLSSRTTHLTPPRLSQRSRSVDVPPSRPILTLDPSPSRPRRQGPEGSAASVNGSTSLRETLDEMRGFRRTLRFVG